MIKKIQLVLRNIPGSRLCVHNFSEKAKKEIRDKQQKKATKKKDARDPNAIFLAARYVDAKDRECVPITAFKKSIVTAATAFDDMKKVALRQSIFVSSALDPAADLLPIETYDGKQAIGTMREDAVTIGMGKRDLAYRPEYPEWQLRVTVEYNSRMVSEEQLLALITQAGWGVGICEGRPEKTSSLGWGRYLIHESKSL
jgi:hypothetical protein